MDMIVGLIGALIGGLRSSFLGFGGVGQHGLIISIMIAVIGAVILTWVLRLITVIHVRHSQEKSTRSLLCVRESALLVRSGAAAAHLCLSAVGSCILQNRTTMHFTVRDL
jgi:hypothetical protein